MVFLYIYDFKIKGEKKEIILFMIKMFMCFMIYMFKEMENS